MTRHGPTVLVADQDGPVLSIGAEEEPMSDGANYCATCGDRVYRLDMARCDGCDKAPTFCDCLKRRRAEQERRRKLARSRATAR